MPLVCLEDALSLGRVVSKPKNDIFDATRSKRAQEGRRKVLHQVSALLMNLLAFVCFGGLREEITGGPCLPPQPQASNLPQG